MRHVILAFAIVFAPAICHAGALAQRYGMGFEGVLWGDSLEELVKKVPNGNHYFSNFGGLRTYHVEDEQAMFGLARKHMQDYYFFDESDSVVSVVLMFPYEERMKLMGTLTVSFGPYRRMQTKGITTIYTWPADDGTIISLEETSSPNLGILGVEIYGPNSALVKSKAANCTKSPAQKSK